MGFKGIWLRPAKDVAAAGIAVPADFDIVHVLPKSEDELIEACRGVDFIFSNSNNPVFSAKFFENCRPKVLQLSGTGYDRVDMAAATKNGVPVCNAPENTRSVAEYVITAIGVLARRLLEGNELVKKGMYLEARDKFVTPTMRDHGCGQRLAIIGLGKIGREVARIGQFFGYDMAYTQRHVNAEAEAQYGLKYLPLPELLGWADYVAVCVSLTPETHGLIGWEQLKMMKRTAILVNAARGQIVDETALARALQEGVIWAAAVDVYVTNPPPVTHPFFQLSDEVKNRLFCTPHVAGRTLDSHRRQFGFSIDNVRRHLVEGKPLACVVNPEALKHIGRK